MIEVNDIASRIARGVARGLLVLGLTYAASAEAGPALDKIKQAGKIVYCSDLSAPPFLFLDPKTLKPDGFDIDVGIAVAKGLGVTAEYKNMAFDGLIPALQAGQCDAILSSLYDKPARRAVVDFVNYANVGNSVMVKAGATLHVNSLAELSGKKVSAERGSVNEQELQDANAALAKDGKPPINIVSLPKISDAVQQMLTGLTDAFYAGTATEATYNKQQGKVLQAASPQISSFYTGIATLKANSDVHAAIDAAFQATRKNGEYDAIVKKWDFESMTMTP